jgi:hypothetical protein
MKKTKPAEVSLDCCEIEINYSDISLESIASYDDFYAAMKSFASEYNESRETYPADFSPDEIAAVTTIEPIDNGPFIEPPPEGFIRLYQSAVSKHASYNFECDPNKTLKLETREFRGYNVVMAMTQSGEDIYYECQDSGRPNEEPFGYIVNDKDGHLIENCTDAYFLISEDEWDEDSEQRLGEIAEEWYAEIFSK